MNASSNAVFNVGRRFLVAALVLLAAGEAFARANDLNLTSLVLRNQEGVTCPTPGIACFSREVHVPLFKRLSTELGVAFAPNFTTPAETLGSLGFEIGFSTALTGIRETAPYWYSARRNEEGPDGILGLTTLHIRKGFPASFELSGNASWLANSEMFAMGLEIKWALNEGFYYIPDVAIRGTVNVVTGARDMNLVSAGFDLSISKAFSVGGTTTLTPYTGYNLLVINTSSHVLDPTPQNALDIEHNFVFAPETLIAHRFFIGLRLKAYFFTLTAAAELTFRDLVPMMQTYVGKLGFDF